MRLLPQNANLTVVGQRARVMMAAWFSVRTSPWIPTMTRSSPSIITRCWRALAVAVLATNCLSAAELPDPSRVETVKLLEVPSYCEGVVFDHAGNGYVSWGKSITQFTLDGKQK